jgi:hypothetical protein
MKSSRLFAFYGLYGMIALSLSGCELDSSLTRLSQEWEALKIVLAGGSSPLAKRPEPQTNQRKLPPSLAAERAKRNAEMLEEVLSVVYSRKPSNRGEFGSLVDTLNQGASIEGLYNGFTHSSDYRKLEVADPGSTPAALKVFVQELAYAEVELSAVTEFGPAANQPLGMPVQPTGEVDSGNGDANVVDFSHSPTPAGVVSPSASLAVAKPSVEELKAKYLSEFSGASIFTLKRVLGDEMLKLVDEKGFENDHASKALQAWYGPWVMHMASYNVDFGLPLRNRADAVFHSQWAAAADSDSLKWEVLNRVHRVLNSYNAQSATVPSSTPSGVTSP